MNASRLGTRALVCALSWLSLSVAAAQELGELRVGNWIEVKGGMDADGHFLASAVEVLAPSGDEVLIGEVRSVDTQRDRFTLLGVEVRVSEKTSWSEVSLKTLREKRVKVEGHYRGAGLFSARKISARSEGRDRIEGRIDALRRHEGFVEALVMAFKVRIPDAAKIENTEPFAGLALAPEVVFTDFDQLRREKDDYVPGSIRLAENLSLGALIEYKYEDEIGFDLDDNDPDDLAKQRFSVRAQLDWKAKDDLRVLLSPRYEFERRRDEDDPDVDSAKPHWNEAYVYWSDIAGTSVDLQVGRQTFDEPREWIYKKNLDGARAIWYGRDLRLELSATTVIDDGSDSDKHTDNYIAYFSNRDDNRHLAAYIVDRRDDRSPRDYPIFFGTRAIGDWIPDNKSWLEASIVRGYSDDVDLEGYGFDVGTTWAPEFTDPVYWTLGYAFGSGDDSSSSDTDESFQQTGLQRNNDKFRGVTSFRYYGELVDPELSNLAILTAGIGARVSRRLSIDLVYHDYRQVEAADFLSDSNLDADPDGVHESLGQELDLVLGARTWRPWEFEVVLGWFHPGDAFPDADDAYLVTFQWRYRF